MARSPLYLVGLVSVGLKYRGQIVKAADRADLELGEPVLERPGVAQRRFIVAHDFTPGQVAWINNKIAQNVDDPADIFITDTVPANWRFVLTV